MTDEYIHDDYHPSDDDDREPCEHENQFYSEYHRGYVCDACGRLDLVVTACDLYGHSWQACEDGADRCIRCGEEQF